MIKKICNN